MTTHGCPLRHDPLNGTVHPTKAHSFPGFKGAEKAVKCSFDSHLQLYAATPRWAGRCCGVGYRLLQSIEQATLAQLVERLIRNQQVAGSIPAGGSS